MARGASLGGVHNADVASAFETIAALLEFQGANPFRVRAYRRAAQTVAALSRNLTDICAEGGEPALREIDGIGQDLAAKIAEMCATGDLAYLRELRGQVPEGILAIMDVEGVGPKKAKQVATALGVRTLADLERVATDGSLAAQKGWGEKSAANVLRAIAQKRTTSVRLPIGRALPIAREIADALRSSGLCDRVEIAGSLRRCRETIGDIDILTTSHAPIAVLDLVEQLSGVRRVLGRGPTKCSVLMRNGVQCDVRVVDPAVFGAALHYFTGSKDHNVALRTLAIKRGITMSEYGVFRGSAEEKGELLASATEEDVFGALGLPYIAPELRENRGEVDAAMDGRLPRLIEQRHIRGDLHVHSDVSDGEASMEDMARAAKAVGLEYVGFADHASSMGMVRGIKEKSAAAYLRRVDAARAAVPGIRLFAGVEVDILPDGSLYLSDDALAGFDYVIASVHGSFKQSRAVMTQRIIRAIEHPAVRIVGHPTARILGRRAGVDVDMDAIFRAAKLHDTALELNASPERLDLDDLHCRRAIERGVLLSMNSDAHAPAGINVSYGIGQARRGWVEPRHMLNTMTATQVQRWFSRGRAGE